MTLKQIAQELVRRSRTGGDLADLVQEAADALEAVKKEERAAKRAAKREIAVVVQNGGSGREFYLWMGDKREVRQFRKECEKDSYATSEPIFAPAEIAKFANDIEEIIDTAVSM